jgi:hypothetical protein
MPPIEPPISKPWDKGVAATPGDDGSANQDDGEDGRFEDRAFERHDTRRIGKAGALVDRFVHRGIGSCHCAFSIKGAKRQMRFKRSGVGSLILRGRFFCKM